MRTKEENIKTLENAVINDLNIAKLILCNPQMIDSTMCIKIGQIINNAIELLKGQEPIKPVHNLGITRCGNCNCEIDKYEGIKYCSNCGRKVKWDD